MTVSMTLPDGFLLLAANELFDAIPIRQFVKTAQGFSERLVGLDAAGELAFAAGVASIDPGLLPASAQAAPLGTVFEVAPARDAVMATLSERIRTAWRNGRCDRLRPYRQPAWATRCRRCCDHQFDPPLAHPGQADITSHVDFEQLARRAAAENLQINGLTYQGDFLIALGLAERAAALGRDKGAETQENIRADAERLAGSGEGKMGELFKVLVVSSTRMWPSCPSRNSGNEETAATPAVVSMD